MYIYIYIYMYISWCARAVEGFLCAERSISIISIFEFSI